MASTANNTVIIYFEGVLEDIKDVHPISEEWDLGQDCRKNVPKPTSVYLDLPVTHHFQFGV